MRSILLSLMLLFSQVAFANSDCIRLLRREKDAFAQISHQKNPTFHISLGKKFGQPSEKIVSFLDALERVHKRAQLNESVKERLRASYYERFVIKPEDVPESYFMNQQRIARERGHGLVEITEAMRAESTQILISDQRKSLDTWFDYFLSSDAQSYPFYIKYWSFTSMLKLSKFDLEAGAFLKRSRTTVAPFPELNREALAKLSDLFAKKLRGEAADYGDEAYQKLLAQADFAKLYSHELLRLHAQTLKTAKLKSKIDGIWVKYPQGSDHMPLVRSLEGKNTGWCTAGESTAESQLSEGDFHVYYSFDEHGKPTNPRVAIRMEGDSIGEVRGVGKDQNLDDAISGSDVVETKLGEFGSAGKRYTKKDADMKRLTDITKRSEAGEALSKEDLRFLYEIDSPINGFGYKRDPRISEVISKRNKYRDLAYVFDCKETEVSFTREEALRGGVKFHYGDLDLSDLTKAEGLKLPRSIGGKLNLTSLGSAKGLKLPETIGGDLSLNFLRSAEGLKLPETIGGDLSLGSLGSAEGLQFPGSIGGNLYLPVLVSAKGVKLPRSIGGKLDLGCLTSAEGLQFPESIGGDLYLRSLSSPNGLNLPRSIGGSLSLSSLTSAEGLNLPKSIGDLFLNSLTSAKGLNLPDSVGGGLYLSSLISAEGLKLPKSLGEGLDLKSLRSAEGLSLPKLIGGAINLSSLISAKGLNFPRSINGSLSLDSLTSAEGLNLPKSIAGDFNLQSLASAEGLRLPDFVEGYFYVSYKLNTKGLKLPKAQRIVEM